MPDFFRFREGDEAIWNSRIDGRDPSEACTHNCATCQSACGADGSGLGKFEKALDAVSEIDAQELLKALEEI